ncbi:NADH-dependent formate dehydrogenase delta subunit FdsD [Pseudovibrio axinellae]|uniref:NADH-dependent formate dehydrogenase delta subunit FdsD n=1 Tax=Pseudovibrio axinellae TaxID=989403 RepID=A0A165WA88_9HYPH|nr:formate dehydrogenase subunit delta [Pseudovibrio axinellae]KZL16276.1 NADH-dependent formate dehydrogenase delta subunit FdsD [Pseudovibrio axinellae]SER78713.1 formate dehydrogenase delta subunit [Pseudovibrio axinellae]
MSAEKLTYMANQIANFFKNKPHEEAVAGIANHINDFWEPRMRLQLFEIIKQGGEGLSPLVVAAEPAIRKPAKTSS